MASCRVTSLSCTGIRSFPKTGTFPLSSFVISIHMMTPIWYTLDLSVILTFHKQVCNVSYEIMSNILRIGRHRSPSHTVDPQD